MGDKLEQQVFENCARAWPHEIHAIEPDRFWEFFRRERPGVSREQMKSALSCDET